VFLRLELALKSWKGQAKCPNRMESYAIEASKTFASDFSNRKKFRNH
jgi:hypothetical protein